MPEVYLTQAEADSLIAMEKHRIDDRFWSYPQAGEGVSIPLISEDKHESFFLDIHRGRIDLRKGTYQNRSRGIIVLIRLDFGSQPHRNPDGTEIGSPHIHIYREGFGDKWAFEVPNESFPHLSNRWQTLQDFMRYCSIVNPPILEQVLF